MKLSYILDSLHAQYNTSKVFCLIWWLELTANESQKSVSQNIRIFPNINQKKDLQNRKVQVL